MHPWSFPIGVDMPISGSKSSLKVIPKIDFIIFIQIQRPNSIQNFFIRKILNAGSENKAYEELKQQSNSKKEIISRA